MFFLYGFHPEVFIIYRSCFLFHKLWDFLVFIIFMFHLTVWLSHMILFAYCFSMLLIHSLSSSERFCPLFALFYYISLLGNPFSLGYYLPCPTIFFTSFIPFSSCSIYIFCSFFRFFNSLVVPFLIGFPHLPVHLFPSPFLSFPQLFLSHSLIFGDMLSGDCLLSSQRLIYTWCLRYYYRFC